MQGWPEPYICTVYDRMYGDFPAKHTVCITYIPINVWFEPTLGTERTKFVAVHIQAYVWVSKVLANPVCDAELCL